MSEICIKCGEELCQLDRALHRKLINRGATEFMCKKCLAAYLDTTPESLDELAAYYKSQGCKLFD